MLPEILSDGYETADSPDELLTELGEDGVADVETALGVPVHSLCPGGETARLVFGQVSPSLRPYVSYREDWDRLGDRPFIGFYTPDRNQDFALFRNPNSGRPVLVAYLNSVPVTSMSGIGGTDLPMLVGMVAFLWRYANLVSNMDIRVVADGVADRLEALAREVRDPS